MFFRYSIFSLVLFGCTGAAATRATVVPSEPATWSKDFTALVAATPECPGGTVEQLRKRMSVSEPYSPRAYEAAHQTSLESLRGLVATDRLHEFYYRADLVGGGFWGFAGYLVVRGGCIAHVQVAAHDN
jgi:hypothetical protein